jgi:2-polyprenyl-3-methyl-5-hydroxy-6-metoxy-1,4-benzoquinol methylase
LLDSLKSIPFFFQSHPKSDNGGFPETLPFHLFFDNELKMFRQKPTARLRKTLDQVYRNGSLAEGSISSGFGVVYIDKIINYLFKNFSFIETDRILEVGFGSGVLLRELNQKGVKNLTGIEPGNHHRVEGLSEVKLVSDFFPSKFISEQYNLIYSMLVLEHIEDPLQFINNLIEQVTNNGKIIFGVPNCEPYLKKGDISIFIHEHFSYFTIESSIMLIKKKVFQIEDISIIEGAFLVTISRKASGYKYRYDLIPENLFVSKIHNYINNIISLLKNYDQRKVAIYAPIRALNFLYLAGKTNVRLVDDNFELKGRFLPSLSSSVESFEDLVLTPPEIIIIFSTTFGERIKEKCKSDSRLQDTLVLTLNEIGNQ